MKKVVKTPQKGNKPSSKEILKPHIYKTQESTKKRVKPHPLSVIWGILTTIILVFSVVLNNKYVLYLGLITAILTIVLTIKISSYRNQKPQEKKPEIKPETKKQARVSSMKRFITIKNDKYETDIDKLYSLVNKYKAVKMSEVKQVFNITQEKAEQWSQILESHELIELHYPAFGEPELRWKQ